MIPSILNNGFRDSDIVARLGGEEFAVMLVDVDENMIFELFENIRKKVEKNKIVIDNIEINFTVSIGVCIEMKQNLEEMISSSDRMLYEAKNSGRNKIVIER